MSIQGVAGATGFAIDGSPVTVTVTVTNGGNTTLKDVALAARITQGAASREAGTNTPVTCGNGTPGVLPKGATCQVDVAVTASNSSTGSGTLTAGSANLETSVVQASGRKTNVLATRSDGISLSGGSGPGGSEPFIETLSLSASEITIEGTGVGYDITIENPGDPLTGVFVQGEIVQNGAVRGAGGTNVMCPTADGTLPTGACTFTWSASAANTTGGAGTLFPGVASLIISIGQDNTIFDADTIPVTLVSDAPIEAYIAGINPNPGTFVIGGGAQNFTIELRNVTDATFDNIVLHATILQDAAFRSAGDNQINCNSRRGVLPPGTCFEGFGIQASNATGGNGTLVPGSAILEIELTRSGQRLSLVRRAITLTQ